MRLQTRPRLTSAEEPGKMKRSSRFPRHPPPRCRLLPSPPGIFQRAFRFLRMDQSLELPEERHPVAALTEVMRQVVEAMARKAYSLQVGTMQMLVRFQAWG